MAVERVLRPIGFSPWKISATVNTEIVEQHVGEAAFLWSQRDRAVLAPHYHLQEIARLDERVEAHLDGLRFAGQTAWKLAIEASEKEAAGTVFVPAVLALESRVKQRIEQILVLGLRDGRFLRQVISALGWVNFEYLKPTLEWLIQSDQPELRSLAIAGYELHRIDPGESLRKAMSDANAVVVNRTFQVAGILGRTDLAHIIVRALSAADEDSRYFSAWACARLGLRDRDVIEVLRTFAESESPYAQPALDMALRCMDRYPTQAWVEKLLKNPKLLRRAVVGIGVFGDVSFIGHLLSLMQVDKLSRVAAESFAMITGVDLKYSDLTQDKPEGFEAGPNEDPSDPDVAMDADEDLPWPNPVQINAWWDKHQSNFQPGRRYLLGQPIDDKSLKNALRVGFQRQRMAAAIELGLLNPTQVIFDTRRPGKSQLKEVGDWTS